MKRLALVSSFAALLALSLSVSSCGGRAPACDDGVLNGDESAVDCGGSCVIKCRDTEACTVGTDCESGCCSSLLLCTGDSDKDGLCDIDDDCQPPLPDCTGKVCGDDGCGGSCGECGENEACVDGDCVIESLNDWPAGVTLFPFLDDQTFEGNIADGEVIDMGWADEPLVSCWLFNVAQYFSGSQVYYAMDKPLQKASQLTITVTPEEGVDLNVYAFGLELGTFYFPPLVPEVNVCASSRTGGEGESEQVYLQNLQAPLEWLIAVSGPEGVTEGAFTLTIGREDLLSTP